MDPAQTPNPVDPNHIGVGNARMSRSFIIGWSFFLALLFGFIAVIFSVNAINPMVHGKTAEGTVVAVQVNDSPGQGPSNWNADIAYIAQDGKQYRGTIIASLTPYSVGETVSILYDPNDPSQIQTANYFFLFVQVALFWIVPLAAIIIIIVVLVKKPKDKIPS